MQDSPVVDRRTVITGVGTLAVVGTLAGCSTDDGGDGADGGDGGDGGDGTSNDEVDEYLSDTTNYDGIQDATGQSSATVDVGVEANGGNFGYGPAAIQVDTGTTVTWEWTGEGGTHNVVAEDDAFNSGQAVDDPDETFEYTFDETGTFPYYCVPHESVGMKGAVVVV